MPDKKGGTGVAQSGKLLDKDFGATDYTPPTSHDWALYTVAPADDGTGGTEVSTGVWTNYARKELANNTTSWPATAAGAQQKTNAAKIDFGTSAVTGTPPIVVAFAIFAHGTSTMVRWGVVEPAATIQDGVPVSFEIGAVTIKQT